MVGGGGGGWGKGVIKARENLCNMGRKVQLNRLGGGGGGGWGGGGGGRGHKSPGKFL